MRPVNSLPLEAMIELVSQALPPSPTLDALIGLTIACMTP